MPQFHHFQLGQFNCTSLIDMYGDRDMWSTFPNVPKAKMQAALDEVGMTAEWVRHGNVLLVDTGEEKVLIDAGLPTAGGGLLVENLAAMGLKPDDIDIVVITHGDGDHIGGLSNFSQARIILPQESYRLWVEEVDGMVEEFVRLLGNLDEEQLAGARNGRLQYPNYLKTLGSKLTLVPSSEAFLPGFRFVDAPGHRRDHFAVEIQSDGQTLLHVADAWRHPIHCNHPDYPCLFDSYPDQLAQTTRQLMARAADSGALVLGAHFPFPGLIRIERDADGNFTWVD